MSAPNTVQCPGCMGKGFTYRQNFMGVWSAHACTSCKGTGTLAVQFPVRP